MRTSESPKSWSSLSSRSDKYLCLDQVITTADQVGERPAHHRTHERAQIYPAPLRALDGGVASTWLRAASMANPIIVGWVLPHWGMNAIFLVFGLVALTRALVTGFFAIETRDQAREQLSPIIANVRETPVPTSSPGQSGVKGQQR